MILAFDFNITTDEQTGEVLSFYLQVRRGKVAQTVEFADGAVLADYDRNGYLLGIEVLAPCKTTIMDAIAANESAGVRQKLKKVLRNSAPQSMIAA